MAEITEIELKVKTDTAGLKDIQKEYDKTSKAIQESNEGIHSSFEQLNNDVSLFQKYVEELDKSSSTFSQNTQKTFKELGKSTDELKQKFERIGLIFAAGFLGPEVTDILLKGITFIAERIKQIFENRNLAKQVQTAISVLKPFIDILVNAARTGDFKTIIEVFKFLAKPITDSFANIFNGFKELLNRAGEFSKVKFDQFSEFVNQLKEAGKLKLDQISNFLKSVRANSGKLARDIIEIAGKYRLLITLLEGLSKLRIPPQIAIPVAILAAIALTVFLIEHWDELDEIIARIPETIARINEDINNLISTSIAFMSGVITKVTDTVSRVRDGAKEKASEAWDGIKGVVSEAVETIKGYYGGISESLSDAWKSAKETTSNAWDSIEERVSAGVKAIKEKWGDIKESVDKAFEDAFGGPEAPIDRSIPLPPVQQKIFFDEKSIQEQLNKEREEIERTNKAIEDQTRLFPPLNNALATAGGEVSAFTIGQGYMSDATNGVMASVVSLREKGVDPLAGQTDELADRIEVASGQVEQAEGTFNTYGISLGNVNDLNKVFGVTQDQVNQTLEDGTVAFDNVGASAEGFGDTIEEVQNKGGFFEGIKQGFIDFVENVQSNSELMADFFADTLSQMSQNFSDLFFNVLTGKFDDLADLAKQAFEAILRAFLDLVSAIVTKQIVISIAGVFGFGKSGGGGGLDFAKQVFGIFEDAGSFFGTGSAAAGAGAAVAGAGGGVIASGSGLGGFAASGLSSVGTTSFGATSVADVFAAGGGLSAVTAGTEAATEGNEEYRLAA